MYRLLALLVLVTFADSVHPPTSSDCNPPDRRAENSLESLAQELLDLEVMHYGFCHLLSNYSAWEVYGENTYRLEYELPGYMGNFDVRTIQKTVVIFGHDVHVKTCDKTFVALRQLPFFVDPRGASWYYENSTLYVEFPFKYELYETQTDCGEEIDGKIIRVKKGTPIME